MTEDQLKYYQNFLCEQGYTSEVIGRDCLSIQFRFDEQTTNVACVIPRNFPYQFPIIRLTEGDAELFRGLPHQFADRSICLFNSADARPNFLNQDQLLLASVKKAESILREGISGTNMEDFQKEFLEYWDRKVRVEFRSFFDFPDHICRFTSKYIKEVNGTEYMLIAGSREKIEELSSKINHDKTADASPEYGLYIPLSKSIYSHEIQNEKDMWKAVAAGLNTSQRKLINAEMQALNNDCRLFVASIPGEDGKRTFFGWVGSRIKQLPGFRRNRVSPFVYWEMMKSSDLLKICAAQVTRCSQKYLFYRGSYGFERRFVSAAIIGCGSVGSELALQLSTMGTDRIILFDNDVLTIDNIARHNCGYSYIGVSKAHAVRYFLQDWNPNIVCESIVGDAFDSIHSHLEKINAMDCLFVAVGDMALEAYIMRMAERGEIRVPVVFLWVEPRCYACHMIYISKPAGAFDVLVDRETVTYRHTVVVDDGFIEHVPGCRTGYIPYSGLDVKQYLSRCLHTLSDLCVDPKLNGNYHMIWTGELSRARRESIRINDEFKETPDYSLVLKRFD